MDREWPRIWVVVGWTIVVIGVLARLGLFAVCLPLRVDEIRLAQNVFDRSFAELALPLDHHQAAPLGFLWLSKAAVTILGRSELALRAVPLMSGVALPLVVLATSRRLLAARAGVIAVALISFSPALIFRSADFKQYSSDALATGVMVACLVFLLNDRSRSLSRWVFVVCAGLLALILSHAGPFIVAAAGIGAVVSQGLVGRRMTVWIATIALAWMAALAVVYWIHLADLASLENLRRAWESEFLPTESVWSALRWLAASIGAVPNAALRIPWPVSPLFMLIAAGGLVALLRQQRGLAVALAGMFVFPLAAAALHLYPFGGRLLVFLAPAVALLTGTGWGALLRHLRSMSLSRHPLYSAGLRLARHDGLTVGLLISLALIAAVNLQSDRLWRRRCDLEGALEYVSLNARLGDLTLTSWALTWPIRYYGSSASISPSIQVQPFPCAADDLARRFQPEVSAGRRVWIVVPDAGFLSQHRGAVPPRRRLLESIADTGGTIHIERFTNVSVLLWTH